ncbi:MAG: hypothetical protein SZ59_C0001G0072 [candidate division TM6 bacterium GW2011_GWF2_28_16]|nr:MAG: hypothetical protein SZ59_C0001G0072 [candidate division TM6 bacterium GW2011_GWF2_28_16]
MKSLKKIVLAIMLLYSFNLFSADITLINSRGIKYKIETLDAAIDKITEENNDFINLISRKEIAVAEAEVMVAALKNEHCKLTLLELLDKNISDELKKTINFTSALCAINNLKRMIENDEINENNYKEIVNNVKFNTDIKFKRYFTYFNDFLLEDWYNSLQEKEELQYLDAEYKEELAKQYIKNSDAAVKYIKDKFKKLYKILSEFDKKNKNFDEFIDNKELKDILGIKELVRDDLEDLEF